MDQPSKTDKTEVTNDTNKGNLARQPGTAWVEQPVKVDGLTNAETTTKTTLPAKG